MAGMSAEGRAIQWSASYGFDPEFRAYMESHPLASGRGSAAGRAVVEGKPIQISDVLADPEYQMTELARIGGISHDARRAAAARRRDRSASSR